jgi:hypothetical protein
MNICSVLAHGGWGSFYVPTAFILSIICLTASLFWLRLPPPAACGG